ncbi:murein biosynthesis integral membrane protein MurJ [Neomegalonema sp.]|uniref:murein biosynthesis integral membrane protein MurJ n=1 Tax=Neomegalonema sp. TaxID=2039713 RepID=UPI00262F48F8|nr:murein biosynthesis integral membrane protein MurJ [Neomegalonema sp.]MDD2868756.1 murein biosynthesis integral membrane protein MurJ [Neomegalonema sp.]
MSLGRAMAAFGGVTLLSRVAGLARDVMIARYLGAGPASDAFFAAFRLPNMFRRIFAEGAFTTAFMPMFAKALEREGPEKARDFGSQAQALLGSVLVGVTLIALIFMPVLVYVIAAGFGEDPDKRDLAILLARIMFPYLALISLTALYSAMLNALGRFAITAAAPILLNVFMILGMVLAARFDWPMAQSLAISSLLAGFGQLWIVWRAARKLGMSLGLRRPRLTPEMKGMARFALPAAISGGAMQTNIVIGTTIASFFAGAVSWLSSADRLYQLPLGLVGAAIGAALLPELSRRAAAEDARGAQEALNRAMEFGLLGALPAATALLAIPGTLISVMFERGGFGPADTLATAQAVALYALGVPAFVLLKAVAPIYYAREDSKTPLRYALRGMAVNTILSLGGVWLWDWRAIPLATSVAAWANLWMLWRGAAHDPARVIDARLRKRGPLFLLAALIMAALAWGADRALMPELEGSSLRYLGLAGIVLGAMAAYGLSLMALGAGSLAEVKAALRRRA